MPGPSPAKARAHVVEILGQSVNHAIGLRESLEAERQALQENDADALHLAVGQKESWINQLKELEQSRARICEDAGFAIRIGLVGSDRATQRRAVRGRCHDARPPGASRGIRRRREQRYEAERTVRYSTVDRRRRERNAPRVIRFAPLERHASGQPRAAKRHDPPIERFFF